MGATTEGKSKTDSGSGEGFQPITTQEDLNRVIADRVNREKAKFADYAELQAKAARLDAAEAAAKTAEEKFNERLAAVEGKLTTSEANSMRWRIAAKHGISDEDAELFLLGTDEETLEKQATRLADRASAKKKTNVVTKEGTTTDGGAEDTMREFTRTLFNPEGDNS